MKKDVYSIITDRLIAALEAGTAPWHKTWTSGSGGQAVNLTSGKAYRGINVWLLAAAPYTSPYWLTYKQSAALGGSVRKGEKSTPVVFFSWVYKDSAGKRVKTAAEASDRHGFYRYYNVFNVEQCEGIEDPSAAVPVREHEPIREAELIVENMPQRPTIGHGGSRAYYRPATDAVQMPAAETFHNGEAYYSTLFHELAHSTGHESRLNRQESDKPRYKGSEDYSREELVAEMTAAFLCGTAGIENATIDNSASYLASWISALKGEPKLAIAAGAQAQKASDFILNVQW